MNDNCWLKDRCNHRDCNTFCMRFFKLNNLYDQALIPLNSRKHTILRIDKDNTDENEFIQLKDISDNIVDFVKNGKNMFIYSEITGNGKTSWSLRMIESYFDKIWVNSELTCKALFISVPRFLLALKENIKNKSEYIEHINENVLDCDIVIWDDIATKLGTEFELSHLLSIIDTRIIKGKSNIYTSNLSGEKLCLALGERLYSRIVNYSDYVFQLNGRDKRNVK